MLVVLLALSGCNSLFGVDGFRYDSEPAAGGSAGSGGQAEAGAGGSEGGGGGGQAGGPTATIRGSLLAETHMDGAGGPTTSYLSKLQAGFVYESPSIVPACTRSDAGICAQWDCVPATAARPNAGLIVVTGASLQPLLALTPGPEGNYTSNVVSNLDFFATGDAISFSAAGADVPAFDMVVTAPGEVTITSPTIVDGMTITSGADLIFSWYGTTSGSVELQLYGSDPDAPGHTRSAVCVYPAAELGGALTKEAAGAVSSFADIRLVITSALWTEQQGQLADGFSWSVSAGARRGARTSDGTDVNVTVSFQ